MSILSVAVHAILNGENPFTVFRTAETEVEAWGEKINAHLPAAVQSFIADEVSAVKKGASDAIALADTLAGPFLNAGADTINGAFVAVAAPYLGPFTGMVTKAEVDMVNKLRDHFVAELHQEALALLAQRATPLAPAVAAPPVPQ